MPMLMLQLGIIPISIVFILKIGHIMKKIMILNLLLTFSSLPIFSKDFNQQRIFSAFLHSSFYMLSADEQQAWKEFCKQGNLPSEIQKSQGYAVNEISLVEKADEVQRIMYAALLTGYCMGKYNDFIVDEWR